MLFQCVNHVQRGTTREFIPRQTFVFTILHRIEFEKTILPRDFTKRGTVNHGKTRFHDNRLHEKGNDDVKKTT